MRTIGASRNKVIRPVLAVALLLAASLPVAACQAGSQGATKAQPPAGTAPQGTQPPQAATAAPSPQKPLAQVTVALDWYPWSNHTGLYMALENGYYRDEGLDVKIYVPSNPEDVLKLVGAGKDTFGISYQSDVLLAREEGIPVKSIAALVQHPLNSVMTLKESNITRPKQLEGKKVGYPGIPGHEALLDTMMKTDGSSPDRVQLVNVGFDLVPALISKKVDAVLGAYWVHESILAEMEGYPVDVMRVEQWGVPDYYELVLVANDRVTEQQGDMVKAFMRATAKGYADATKDPKKAVDLLVKVNPETNRQMEDKGIQLLMPLWKDGIPAFGWQTKERWQSYATWMKDQKLLTKEPNVDAAFTTDFLPR